MSSYQSYERVMLATLFKSVDWVDLFIFHERYLLSPGQVASFIRRFEDAGLVAADIMAAKLTDLGRRWVLANRQAIFLTPDRVWAEAPQILIEASRIGAFAPYLPDLKRIDERFFLHATLPQR